jgi:hypothetical protein
VSDGSVSKQSVSDVTTHVIASGAKQSVSAVTTHVIARDEAICQGHRHHPRHCERSEAISCSESIKQILPFRIDFVDQVNFILPRTGFDLFFPLDCCYDTSSAFIKNELDNPIFGCEHPSFTSFMLNNSSAKVICNPCVEDCVVFVGHNIDAVKMAFHFVFGFLPLDNVIHDIET